VDGPAQVALNIRAALNGHKRPPAWVDAIDFLAEPIPAFDWVINDLVGRQGRVLLVGAEGAGKSHLSLTAAVQAAAGLPVLDVFGVELPRRTIYADLEMPRTSVARRLNALRISSNLARGALELCLRPDGINIGSADERQDFLSHVQETEPDLVVIDPLYKLTETDAIEEKNLRPVLAFLDDIRSTCNCALILVHHLRKRPQGESSRGRDSSDVFGSSVLLRWPEVILMLHPDEARVVKDRDGVFGDVRTFPVEFGGHWPVSFGDPRADLEEEVFDYIDAWGPVPTTRIRSDLGRPKKELSRALRLLEGRGRVRQNGKGWEARQ
jgi:KaiC/GvpD/RAD55 family RecA-like ATPase